MPVVGGEFASGLVSAGLLTATDDGSLSFCFSDQFFTSEERERFDEYKAAVQQHEDAVASAREDEGVDPLRLRVLDQKRSRLHNGLADHLMEQLPMPGWDHEQYRRWIAAMVRHELVWLSNRALVVTPLAVESIASLPGVAVDTERHRR